MRHPPMHFAALLMCSAATLTSCAHREAAPLAQQRISSFGAPEAAQLMNAWWNGFHRLHPEYEQGPVWTHESDRSVIGGLMFELADLSPIERHFTKTELAPYAHQFHGDMMHAPESIAVARTPTGFLFMATNRRPDAPLPEDVNAFIAFMLSDDGQDLVRQSGRYAPLDESHRASSIARLNGYVPQLDSSLASYHPIPDLAGEIASVGSDGMKALMDRWQRRFHELYPSVTRGELWEHFGTLNGFHALLTQQTDLAPMGRELWPDESTAYQSVFGQGARPLEIRVARGGFNTDQRTTAQAIFVHPRNPIQGLTLDQLRNIFSDRPTIQTWGDLGLDGEWKSRPILVRTPPQTAPNAMSMQIQLFPGQGWNERAVEGTIQETADAIARDVGAIGFGGFEENAGRTLKTLGIARDASGPFVHGSIETAASGQYPLTRYMFIRMNTPENTTIPLHIREFFRFILSKEGQEDVRYSGYYPLSGLEAREELAKLGYD